VPRAGHGGSGGESALRKRASKVYWYHGGLFLARCVNEQVKSIGSDTLQYPSPVGIMQLQTSHAVDKKKNERNDERILQHSYTPCDSVTQSMSHISGRGSWWLSPPPVSGALQGRQAPLPAPPLAASDLKGRV
ncbi:hypothetical protein THAOC_21101, partial [Thalassiosira oceanica]